MVLRHIRIIRIGIQRADGRAVERAPAFSVLVDDALQLGKGDGVFLRGRRALRTGLHGAQEKAHAAVSDARIGEPVKRDILRKVLGNGIHIILGKQIADEPIALAGREVEGNVVVPDRSALADAADAIRPDDQQASLDAKPIGAGQRFALR